MMVHDYIFI